MPGLLRGVARTAVIAGTATAVSNRVSRRQANRWAQQEQAPQGAPVQYAQQPAAQQVPVAPPPPPPPPIDTVAQLKGLAELKAEGILTEAEFNTQKAKILAM
jgi:Short C-terminal domain